jgi:HlyD family secretion protein
VRLPARLAEPAPPQPLAANAAGKVHRVRVGVGDVVGAEQLLLTLDPAELDAQRESAARELERAAQRTRELEQGRAAHERSLRELRAQAESAEQRLHAEASRGKRLSEQRAALQGLEEQGSVVTKSIDVLSQELASIADNVRALALELSRAQLQLASFERERNEQLQRANAELDAAQRASAGVQALLERIELRAPRPGRIRELAARVGDHVQAGQALLMLGTLAPPTRAIMYVRPHDRADLRRGVEVRIELDRPQSALAANVSAIASQPEPNGSYRVELTLAGAPAAVRAGAPAHASFSAKRPPALLRWLAPLRALFE